MKLYDVISINLYDGEVITVATRLTAEEAERRLHDPEAPDRIWGDCATTLETVEVFDSDTNIDYIDIGSNELYGAPFDIIIEGLEPEMITTFQKEVANYVKEVYGK